MKKFLYLGGICLLLLGLFMLFKDQLLGTSKTEENQTANEQSNTDDAAISSDINEIIEQSKHGKIPNSTIKVGTTKMSKLKEKWGNPEQVTQTSEGQYGSYPGEKIALGFLEDTIFDVRYLGPSLKKIHMKDIKRIQGEPDQVNYYKDKQHDQMILVYEMNDAYQLKWVLPKNENENPPVDHISVWTNVQSETAKKVAAMSLQEKIGQMIIAGFSGTTLNEETIDLIQNKRIGGVIFYSNNIESMTQTVTLLNDMKEINKQNKMPLFLSVDQEGGRVSRLPGSLKTIPTNESIGKVNNTKFSYGIGKVIGNELKQFGFNLDYAPVMDVNSNPDNPVIGDRSFSGDPNVVKQLGIETMKGMQSEDIVTVIKHFPGHGDTSVDSHLQLPKVNKSLEDLEKTELIPFKGAIEEGVDMVMIAHILLPQLDDKPASLSPKIINGLLRKQMGYEGVVITDDMTMKAITNHYGIEQASVDSIKAGSDLILVAHDYGKVVSVMKTIKAAVENGEISEERLNESVERIIKLKDQYRLSNKDRENVNVEEINQSIEQLLNTYMNE
ncbi:beta-N-acetylhexosaminidase [Bacillus sp. RAR_GA_16]|uniref:beta-N-acetylhexosaminidase n=1 Tax=Bacillus sp. RAR_GA_16 TaxID=2876774 RepID=UPI001CCF7F90|nr:beta-N-acetylhexosaminidase [Bacillus sp. RAR_GA_16]MCA0174241.1 beta-N-acetylhexosaminidase [Bacillus sp. RAR_GA_16]